MTCEELHSYVEQRLCNAEGRSDSGEITEHIASCVTCRRFVAEQRELGNNLRLVRESVGAIPESLDASAMSNYRLYLSTQQRKQRAALSPGRARLLRWSAVAASVLVAAAILFLYGQKTVTTNAHPTSAPRAKQD